MQVTSIDHFPQQQQNIHLARSHGVVIKIDHILRHETHLHKFTKPEVTQCLLSDSGIKLAVTSRKITGKSEDMWRLNNTFLNNIWVKEEITREIERYFE